MTDTDQPTGTDTTPDRGDWILTYCGRSFFPLDPRPEEVELIDIAHSLGLQCRWTGHVRFHYSIAQHAIAVAKVVDSIMPHLAMAALHHDSAEAYIGDMARPWKRMLAVRAAAVAGVAAYGSVSFAERRIERAIFDALHIPEPTADERAVISAIDNRVLRTEYEQLMPHRGGSWADLGDPIPGLTITMQAPGDAIADFHAAHFQYLARLTQARKAGLLP